MCLGIPAQVVEVVDRDARLVKAELGGVRRTISTALVQEPRFAIEELLDFSEHILATHIASPALRRSPTRSRCRPS